MQAICIIAHNNFQHIQRLCERFERVFEIYIHFDKKMELKGEQLEYLKSHHIHYIQKVSAHWGAWGICEATYLLFKEICNNDTISYVHVISGQDYPVISASDIYNFYENTEKIYMTAELAKNIKKSHEPVLLWMKYYYDYDKINRRSFYGKIYHRISLIYQTLKGVDKFKHLNIKEEIFCGSQWMDLPIDSVKYLLQTFDNSTSLQKLFKTGFCSDEFWIQTILCNSAYKDRIVNNNHRYIKWEHQNGSYPAILDSRDYEMMTNGDYHFARKLCAPYSDELLDKLDNISV